MAPNSESLRALAAAVDGDLIGSGVVVVDDVTHDSRSAGPGVLFVAIRGASSDGHDFVDSVAAAGSPAVMVDHALDTPLVQIVVPDTRAALGPLAAAVHGNPSRDLALIGVTGTNGKTTVTHMIEAICKGIGLVPGLIGTIHTRVGGEVVPTVRTTPEASDFQRLLRHMADEGAQVVAAEVSSHALSFGRVSGSRFSVAAFTNLSQDHLDFHGTMADYRAAKESLFAPGLSDRAVVNIDDPVGREIARSCAIPLTTVGRRGDLDARITGADIGGTDFVLSAAGNEVGSGRVPIAGEFNLSNALVALACMQAIGADLRAALGAVEAIPPVPGRFEMVFDSGPTVVVDYAHSPDGIHHVIDTVRASTTRRLVVVIGAGGDRDRGKRPAMGLAAARTDRVIVTSDNPRSEDPAAIINAVIERIPSGLDIETEPDRRVAIRKALEGSRPDDVILVLGRGHERFQEIGGEMIPFDDRTVIREILAELGMSAS